MSVSTFFKNGEKRIFAFKSFKFSGQNVKTGSTIVNIQNFERQKKIVKIEVNNK